MASPAQNMLSFFRDVTGKEGRDRRALGRIQAGQTIPAFARAGGAEPDSPENIRSMQMAQMAELGTPEAMKVLGAISPMMQKPATPMSSLGKLQRDVSGGLIPEDIGTAAIKRETAPRQPLVKNIFGEGETAGQKQLAQSRADRITRVRDLGDKSSGLIFGANRLGQAIDRGNVGKLEPAKAFVVELGESLGFPIDVNLLQKAKDVRAVEKVLAGGALDVLEGLKGSTSNKDLDFAQRVSGRVDQGKGSLRELSHLMRAGAIKAQQISDAVVQADLNGASLQEQDALIAELKTGISIEDIFNEIVNEPQEAVSATANQDPRVQEALEQGYTMEEIQQFLGGVR